MEYPNSGSLWPLKERKNDKMPNLRGSVKVEVDLLQELINQSSGGLVSIELAAWTKTYDDRKFLSLKVSAPYKKEDRPAPPPEDDDDLIPF